MVILEPEFVDFGYEAVTPQGSREAIRFQQFFYAFSRKFQSLKAAIESCRHEMDRQAAVTVVIEYLDHAEIWTQVETGATIKPKANARSKSATSKSAATGSGVDKADKTVYFRGQAVTESSSQAAPLTQPVLYRGQRVGPDHNSERNPGSAGNNGSSYRGIQQ